MASASWIQVGQGFVALAQSPFAYRGYQLLSASSQLDDAENRIQNTLLVLNYDALNDEAWLDAKNNLIAQATHEQEEVFALRETSYGLMYRRRVKNVAEEAERILQRAKRLSNDAQRDVADRGMPSHPVVVIQPGQVAQAIKELQPIWAGCFVRPNELLATILQKHDVIIHQNNSLVENSAIAANQTTAIIQHNQLLVQQNRELLDTFNRLLLQQNDVTNHLLERLLTASSNNDTPGKGSIQGSSREGLEQQSDADVRLVEQCSDAASTARTQGTHSSLPNSREKFSFGSSPAHEQMPLTVTETTGGTVSASSTSGQTDYASARSFPRAAYQIFSERAVASTSETRSEIHLSSAEVLDFEPLSRNAVSVPAAFGRHRTTATNFTQYRSSQVISDIPNSNAHIVHSVSMYKGDGNQTIKPLATPRLFTHWTERGLDRSNPADARLTVSRAEDVLPNFACEEASTPVHRNNQSVDKPERSSPWG